VGLDVTAAADGIVKIVNSQMVEALRLVTVSRGEDPRQFVMVAFGGAGPVHAAKLAEELKIPRVLVPPVPGVASAMGLLVADLRRDYVQSRFADLASVTAAEVQRHFEAIEAAARRELTAEGIAPEAIACERALDLRYSIQKYELSVPLGGGALTDADAAAWRRLFDERHEQHYGTRAADQQVEIVSYRVTARVALPRPKPRELGAAGESARGARKGSRRAYFDGWVDCPVYDRGRLGGGNRLAGPAIIEQVDSTIVVHPGHEARVDRFGNVLIEIPSRA
jgi:N-methylhydantoinase A